jgi:hypothetical protein
MDCISGAGGRRRTLATVAVAAGVAIAGCGSNSPTAAQSAKQFVSHALAKQVAYAQCMRTHGVPGFQDPTLTRSAVGVGVGVSQGVPASVGQSPAFNSAQHACEKLLPPGSQGPGNQPVTAAQHAQMVKFAVCVRGHGVANMPDPAANGVFHLPPRINQNAPAFQSAIKHCIPNGMSLSLDQS